MSVEDAAAADTPVESDTAPAAAVAVSSEAATDSTPEVPAPVPLDDTGEFDFDDWTLPPDPKRSKAFWLVPVILLIGMVALWLVVFVDSDDGVTVPNIAAAETSSTLATTTTRATTTTAQATTTSTSTTTIVLYPPAESWKSVGDPVPLSALTLKSAGIGPIDFDTPIPEAAGSLVASLGKAQDAGVDSDSCLGTEWYWLEWGDLRGIFDGYTQDAKFVAFQYQNVGPDEADPILETLSGIRLGDTVEELQKTYVSYTVSFEVIEGESYFRLTDGGDLLLWGPVTSTDPQGTIQGIYSQDPCPTPI